MIDDDMTCTIPDPLYRKLSPEKRVELAGKIRHLYFKGAHVTEETAGNPTPHNATVAADTQKVNISWPAVHPGRMNYLEIGDELSVKKDFLKERMNFWDRVYRDTLGTPLYDFF
ncbi:hypothetical protein FOCC_FOCC009337 [Frankliniella occidentalis]|nr:hypothetical protein FOCC_FOCC009337 [Frankliniella occidentalis]